MFKSILVVLGSYILSIILVFCTDPILSKIFPGEFERNGIPSNRALIGSTVAFFVVSVICAWICAKLASYNAAKHVFWLFMLGEAMGLVFTIAGWNSGWPHWYSISWMVVWPIACWLGLKFSGKQS